MKLKTEVKSIYNDIKGVIPIGEKIRFVVASNDKCVKELAHNKDGIFYMASVGRWRERKSRLYHPKHMWNIKTFVKNDRVEEYLSRIKPRAVIELVKYNICVDNELKTNRSYHYFYCEIEDIILKGVIDKDGKYLESEIDNTELKEKWNDQQSQ